MYVRTIGESWPILTRQNSILHTCRLLQKYIPYKEMQFMTIKMLGFLPNLIQNINIVYFLNSNWNGIGIQVYPFLI